MKEMTSEELRKLQEVRPDDSIVISPYEGMSPQDAAKIEEILEKKVGNMDIDEEKQYEAAQQIADKGGVLPSDPEQGSGPFLNSQDIMKKEGE